MKDRKGNLLKQGDKVKFHDNSWCMKFSTVDGARFPVWNDYTDNNLTDEGEVVVVDVDLKVPVMRHYRRNESSQEPDANGGFIYLNTMVQDDRGHLWMSRSDMCEKVIPLLRFKLYWKDGSIESVTGENLGRALMKSGIRTPQLLENLEKCEEG